MGKVRLDDIHLRTDKMEVARMSLAAGESTEVHSHAEEQTIYVEKGSLEVNLGQDTYVVAQGQASFHGPNVRHQMRALENSRFVSFKNLIEPSVGEPATD